MSMEVGSSNAYLANPRHSWWSTQTTKEKKLLVVCGIASILAMIFLICTIGLGSRKLYEPNCVNVQDPEKIHGKSCTTKACKEIAILVQLYMDEEVNPCDNFYKFACGGFEQLHNENENIATVATAILKTQTQKILESSKPEDQENNAAKSVLHLYNKCLKQGTDPTDVVALQNLISEVLGTSLPIALGSTWKEEDFNWATTLAKIMRLHPDFLVQLQINPDIEDYTKLAPWLMLTTNMPKLPPKIKDIVFKIYPDSTSDKIEDDIENLKNALGVEGKTGLYSTEKGPVTPEQQNHKIMRSSAEVIGSFKKFNISQIAKETEVEESSWKEFFDTLLPGKVDDNFRVVTRIDFLRSISALPTDKRALANVLGLTIVQHWGGLYSDDIMGLLNPSFLRKDVCFDFVNQMLGFAVAKMHTDKHLSSNEIQEIEELNKEILNGFRELVSEATWLDQSTKEKATKKVDNLESTVAFPQWTNDKDKLEKHYQDVEPVNKNNFVEGSRLAANNYFNRLAEQIGTKMERKNYWPSEGGSELVNAFYHPLTNSMYYLRGIIMKPIYAPDRPRALKYGSIGQIIGHEITHGFDSEGKGFNENGVVENWWDSATDQNFNEGAKCFINQYSNITDELTKEKLNGTLTLAENIADNGGLRAAFKAYRKSPEDNLGRLIGLEHYSEDQLFFISSAQFWCNKHNADFTRYLIKTDTHSPRTYRALVPYQNFEEFSTAFHCKEGSHMKPDKTCRIW